MIAIIQGCGSNIASLQFALERLHVPVELTDNADRIQAASHVILPGVGHAAQAMQQLQQRQLVDVICQLRQPVLGICLGMQLLFESSAEGDVDCLGVIPGRVEPLVASAQYVVPHMGWNQLQRTHRANSCPLLKAIDDNCYFYFVHSFIAPVNDNAIATTCYESDFTSLVQKGNFFGIQCHPEKSGPVGLRFLENFVSL